MRINLNPTSERGASRDAVNRPRETLGDSHLISSDPRSRFGLVCDLLCCRGNKLNRHKEFCERCWLPELPFLYFSLPVAAQAFQAIDTQLGAASTADPHDGGAGGGRRGAWGGRTVARWTLDANHVSFVPESGWPLRSHGPKPRGGHGGRHAGVDGSLNSGFLYFSLPHARSRPVKGRSLYPKGLRRRWPYRKPLRPFGYRLLNEAASRWADCLPPMEIGRRDRLPVDPRGMVSGGSGSASLS